MPLNFLVNCFGWQPSKMPRGSEKTTLVWLFSLKAANTIPAGITAFKGRDLYRLAEQHPELSRWPYHKNVLLSLLLEYVSVMTLLPWLFLSLALMWRWKGPWVLLYGLVDFGLAVILATSVGMQAEYLPSSLNGCKGDKAVAWQVAGDHKSFFAQIADLTPSEKDTPYDKCRQFVANWTLEVTVLFFQMLISYVGIFFDEREHSMLNPMRPLCWFIIATFTPFFWLHDYALPRIRFGYHYTAKLFQRMRGTRIVTRERAVEELPPYAPRDKYIRVSNPKLQEVLTVEHILLNIVDHSHYEDILSFSLTSKSVREAIFPSQDLPYRIPKLRSHCCELQSKLSCLYCNKRICFWCKAQRFLPGLPGRRHVTQCKPYCKKCYFESFSRHLRGYKKACKCHASDRSHEFQDMCRTCALKDPVIMQVERHRRYEKEARDIAFGKKIGEEQVDKIACGKCKGELKNGMRWWVCGKCQGECRDVIHPPYVGKRKMQDVEKGEKRGLEQADDETVWKRWSSIFSPR